MQASSIPYFKEINDFYLASNFDQRTERDDFYIFRIEDTYPHVIQYMPPFRKSFYHLALLKNSTGASFLLNTNKYHANEFTLLCHSPEHIHSWLRPESMGGYVINFKENFLDLFKVSLFEDFTFFNTTHINTISISEDEMKLLCADFEKIFYEYHGNSVFSIDLVKAYFLALLLNYKRQFATHNVALEEPPASRVYNKFRILVNTNYLNIRNVSAYAAMLNISTGHLCELVKELTGRTPKSFIDERIIIEIQNMLFYTSLSVAEISFKLEFSEPGNLTKFFRKHSGMSPKEYRNRHQPGVS